MKVEILIYEMEISMKMVMFRGKENLRRFEEIFDNYFDQYRKNGMAQFRIRRKNMLTTRVRFQSFDYPCCRDLVEEN